MTSFGWKRRAGASVLKETSKNFEANSKGEEDEAVESGEVDWLTLAPRQKCLRLEDARAKSERLRLDGIILAEAERHWEALQKWEQALHLTPDDERLHEMSAQVLLSLGELYPAVCAAEKAVSLNRSWWVGHQTLGRAQLGLGEVKLALKSFSYAFHIYPADRELFENDLLWAAELVRRKATLDSEKLAAAETEFDSSRTTALGADDSSDNADEIELQRLPPNYVAMRDV